MRWITNWIAEKRWRSSFSHVLLSVPMFAVVYLALALFKVANPTLPATTFIVAWWWSREKVQHEYRLKGSDRTIFVWHKGWLPFEWDRYSILDFLLPSFFGVTLAWAAIIS